MKLFRPLSLGVILSCALLLTASYARDIVWEEKSEAIGAIQALPSGTLSKIELSQLTEIGGELFKTKFTKFDGAGRPAATQAIIPTKARHRAAQSFSRLAGPDSLACSSCHNDPLAGGAGDFITNVFVSEGFTNANFDTTDPQFSNERGTNHLFGAGLVELLAREMSAELATLRRSALQQSANTNAAVKVDLITKGVSFGSITAKPDGLIDLKDVVGVDTDLVIRPFSQKGVMVSLRQFTINAMNHHHGMQASERFGGRWTGTNDFDEDSHNDELAPSDISALVAWQATLRPPVTKIPQSKTWQAAAADGAKAFNEYGCATCHMKTLPLSSLIFQDPGSFDVSGTLNINSVEAPANYDLNLLEWAKSLPRNSKGEVLVPLFGDLKRHKMTDRSIHTLGNELLSQRFVGRNIFMTAELWGIGSTSPYGHRNDFTTLDGIILAHGGEARYARDAYDAAPKEHRSSLIAFLRTLVIE